MANADIGVLKTIITADKHGVFTTNLKQNASPLNRKLKNHPRKPKYAWTKVRENLCSKCLFYYKGLIHYKFTLEGQTVNKEIYIEILRRLQMPSTQLT